MGGGREDLRKRRTRHILEVGRALARIALACGRVVQGATRARRREVSLPFFGEVMRSTSLIQPQTRGKGGAFAAAANHWTPPHPNHPRHAHPPLHAHLENCAGLAWAEAGRGLCVCLGRRPSSPPPSCSSHAASAPKPKHPHAHCFHPPTPTSPHHQTTTGLRAARMATPIGGPPVQDVPPAGGYPKVRFGCSSMSTLRPRPPTYTPPSTLHRSFTRQD